MVSRRKEDSEELSIVSSDRHKLSLERRTDLVKDQLHLKVDLLFAELELKDATKASQELDNQIDLAMEQLRLKKLAEAAEAKEQELAATENEISVKKRVLKRLNDRL